VQIRRILVSIIICFCLTLNIAAAGPLDEGRTGSITVKMSFEDKPVPGGTLTIYQVAVPVWQEDHYEFVYTQPFDDCLLPLDDFSTPDSANGFVEYVIDHDILGIEETISDHGVVMFDRLEQGLYLLVQQEAAEGYFCATPFMISVPMYVEDDWVYDIDATPKVDLEREPVPPPPVTPPDIPQTGMLQWPIPVMAISGIALFMTGWLLFFRRKSRGDEA